MPELDTPVAAPTPADNTPPTTAPETPEQPPAKTYTQAEVDEIAAKIKANEKRKRERIATRLEITEELALRGRPEREPQTPAPKADAQPTREQFDTYEAFIEARAEWRAEKKVEEAFGKREARQREMSAQESANKARETFQARTQEMAKEIPDMAEVLAESEAPLTKPMADAIVESDIGPKIAYHLAKHPDEAQRIASLSPIQQAKEIGKLEAKLDTPVSKQPEPSLSKAPAPIEPVGGKAGPTHRSIYDPKLSDEEWIRLRNDQLRKKRA